MYKELKQKSYEANMLLPKHRLIDLTFGNLSVIDRNAGVFAIKPSGVDYDALRPEDIVIVDLEGNTVESDFNPSSDTPTHRCLYKAFESIGAVVHTHSRYATSFAQSQRPVPCFGTTHADYFNGEIPVTRPMTPEEIQREYEWETGLVIVERFGQLSPEEFPGVLVSNHGPFAWGPTGTKAVENAFAIEILAQMALQTLQLNPQMPPISQTLLNKHFKRKHGASAYYGQGK